MYYDNCYECCEEDGKLPGTLHYKGDGILVCDNCGKEQSVKERTYSILVSVFKYAEKADFCIIGVDEKLKSLGKNDIEAILEHSHMIESDFEDEDEGIYKCDILYYWYLCDHETGEEDIELDILSKRKMELREGAKIPEPIRLDYTEEQKKLCDLHCKTIIDFLKPLSIKEKWLVIETLYDSFPREDLKGEVIR